MQEGRLEKGRLVQVFGGEGCRQDSIVDLKTSTEYLRVASATSRGGRGCSQAEIVYYIYFPVEDVRCRRLRGALSGT